MTILSLKGYGNFSILIIVSRLKQQKTLAPPTGEARVFNILFFDFFMNLVLPAFFAEFFKLYLPFNQFFVFARIITNRLAGNASQFY